MLERDKDKRREENLRYLSPRQKPHHRAVRIHNPQTQTDSYTIPRSLVHTE